MSHALNGYLVLREEAKDVAERYNIDANELYEAYIMGVIHDAEQTDQADGPCEEESKLHDLSYENAILEARVSTLLREVKTLRSQLGFKPGVAYVTQDEAQRLRNNNYRMYELLEGHIGSLREADVFGSVEQRAKEIKEHIHALEAALKEIAAQGLDGDTGEPLGKVLMTFDQYCLAETVMCTTELALDALGVSK